MQPLSHPFGPGRPGDGDLVWSAARGTFAADVDPLDLQHQIASITKTFVAVAVMRLRGAGRLGLNDPIGDHVPGWAWRWSVSGGTWGLTRRLYDPADVIPGGMDEGGWPTS